MPTEQLGHYHRGIRTLRTTSISGWIIASPRWTVERLAQQIDSHRVGA